MQSIQLDSESPDVPRLSGEHLLGKRQTLTLSGATCGGLRWTTSLRGPSSSLWSWVLSGLFAAWVVGGSGRHGAASADAPQCNCATVTPPKEDCGKDTVARAGDRSVATAII